MFAIAEEETFLIKCVPSNNNILCVFSKKEEAERYLQTVESAENTECIIVEVENLKKKV